MSGLELLFGGLMSGLTSAATSVGGVLSTVAPIAGLAGTAMSYAGSQQAAASAQAAAKQDALNMEAEAAAEKAAATRKAFDQRRETQLAVSRQKAVAAASGGGVTGTVLDLMGDTYQQGLYNEGTTVALGEDRALGLKQRAAATRKRAKADYSGSMLAAAGDAAGSLYSIGKAYG